MVAFATASQIRDPRLRDRRQRPVRESFDIVPIDLNIVTVLDRVPKNSLINWNLGPFFLEPQPCQIGETAIWIFIQEEFKQRRVIGVSDGSPKLEFLVKHALVHIFHIGGVFGKKVELLRQRSFFPWYLSPVGVLHDRIANPYEHLLESKAGLFHLFCQGLGIRTVPAAPVHRHFARHCRIGDQGTAGRGHPRQSLRKLTCRALKRIIPASVQDHQIQVATRISKLGDQPRRRDPTD